MATNDFYQGVSKFLLAVDCVILGFHKGELKLLTFRREIEPQKGGLSLPGGFVLENESLKTAAQRVLKTLTGLDDIYMDQIAAYGELNRDPGQHVVSIGYFALINMQSPDEGAIERHLTKWVNIEEKDNLIMDHPQMVNDALTILRHRAAVMPVGFNLLPERFTLPQLQQLYEAIYGEKLDKRNFRKKLNYLNVLERLDIKDKSSSKRGAYFYIFNTEKYNELLTNGNTFTL